MDVFECIATKLDVREFDTSRKVPEEVKAQVLEAAVLTGTGLNTQHWRFILVEGSEGLKTLAQDSTSGRWVAGADFAVIVLTDPKHGFHLLDAGRAAQDMQLAAWGRGVASGLFTGVKDRELRRDFGIPDQMSATAVVAFGYPAKKIAGKKSRRPLSELAYRGRYGSPL